MARRSFVDTHKSKLIEKLSQELESRDLGIIETPEIISELVKLLSKPEAKKTKEELAAELKEEKDSELLKRLARREANKG